MRSETFEEEFGHAEATLGLVYHRRMGLQGRAEKLNDINSDEY